MKVGVGLGNCFFLKNLKNKSPDYLLRKIPQRRSSHIIRNSDEIPLFETKHNFYKNSFFPSTTIEWNNLDQDLRNSESYTLLRSSILKFIRSSQNSIYSCQNIMDIKLVTRPRLGLSHLREQKFKSSFYDTLNSLCNCGMDLEYSTHFLLQCPLHISETCTLMSNLNRINPLIFQLLCNFCQTHYFLGIRVIVTKRIYEFLTLLLTKSLMKHISECVSFLFPLIFLTNLPIFTVQVPAYFY